MKTRRSLSNEKNIGKLEGAEEEKVNNQPIIRTLRSRVITSDNEDEVQSNKRTPKKRYSRGKVDDTPLSTGSNEVGCEKALNSPRSYKIKSPVLKLFKITEISEELECEGNEKGTEVNVKGENSCSQEDSHEGKPVNLVSEDLIKEPAVSYVKDTVKEEPEISSNEKGKKASFSPPNIPYGMSPRKSFGFIEEPMEDTPEDTSSPVGSTKKIKTEAVAEGSECGEDDGTDSDNKITESVSLDSVKAKTHRAKGMAADDILEDFMNLESKQQKGLEAERMQKEPVEDTSDDTSSSDSSVKKPAEKDTPVKKSSSVVTEGKVLQTKWKSLRGHDIKENRKSRSGAGASEKREWPFSPLMSFLDDSISPRPSCSSLPNIAELHQLNTTATSTDTCSPSVQSTLLLSSLPSASQQHFPSNPFEIHAPPVSPTTVSLPSFSPSTVSLPSFSSSAVSSSSSPSPSTSSPTLLATVPPSPSMPTHCSEKGMVESSEKSEDEESDDDRVTESLPSESEDLVSTAMEEEKERKQQKKMKAEVKKEPNENLPDAHVLHDSSTKISQTEAVKAGSDQSEDESDTDEEMPETVTFDSGKEQINSALTLAAEAIRKEKEKRKEQQKKRMDVIKQQKAEKERKRKEKLKHLEANLPERLDEDVVCRLPDAPKIPTIRPSEPKKKKKRHVDSSEEKADEMEEKPLAKKDKISRFDDYIPIDNVEGATKFGVVPLQVSMRIPKSSSEMAAEFKRQALYGSRIKREPSKFLLMYKQKMTASGKDRRWVNRSRNISSL